MSHYFDLKKIGHSTWSRRANDVSELDDKVAATDVVLLLISDRAISDFFSANKARLERCRVVHFSGAQVVDGAFGCHPLASFGEDLFPLELYEQVGFVTDEGPDTFSGLFPQLQNPALPLAPSKRARYHALAVLSGNFTVMLWEKAFAGMVELGLPAAHVRSYLNTVHHNLVIRPGGSLTGPLARGDTHTMRMNLDSLGSDPFADVYRSFVRVAGIELEQK